MRVLVIDDSRAMRTFLRRLLTRLGFEVVEAADGLEAQDRMKDSGQIDLALIDWNMPKCDGFEFLVAVRSHSKWNDVKLLMATTESEVDQIVKALDAGADEYLMKPFDEAAVVDKLRLIGVDVDHPVA